jgi:hypothetical protein
MQAAALVMNPCFYKGFFSTTDKLWMAIIFLLSFRQIMDLSIQKNYFSGLINLRRGTIMI